MDCRCDDERQHHRSKDTADDGDGERLQHLRAGSPAESQWGHSRHGGEGGHHDGPEAALAGATTAEWVPRFEEASIAGGPIYELDEVFDDPQVRHLELLAEVEQPTYEAHGGRARMLGFPFRASATPASIRRPAPLLGEHTAEVLRELLDLSGTEIARLKETGAIGFGPAR